MEVTGSNATEIKSAGQQLQAARLARGQSIEDVARQLRLSVRQIAALEDEDYSKLPSGTFLRGFVRNYAKLVQLDAGPLLQSIQQSLPPASPQTMLQQPMEIPFPSDRGTGKRNLFVIGLILVLGLPLLAYEIYRGSEQEQPPAVRIGTESGVEQAAAQPQSQPALPPVDAGADTGADAETMQPAEPAEADQQKNDNPPPALQAAASAVVPESSENGKAILRFAFIEKSWVQVRDGEGKTIFSQINPEGSEQVVSGKPPFSLVIGNAASVTLTYNDKPVDLAPHIRQQVANLKLE